MALSAADVVELSVGDGVVVTLSEPEGTTLAEVEKDELNDAFTDGEAVALGEADALTLAETLADEADGLEDAVTLAPALRDTDPLVLALAATLTVLLAVALGVTLGVKLGDIVGVLVNGVRRMTGHVWPAKRAAALYVCAAHACSAAIAALNVVPATLALA